MTRKFFSTLVLIAIAVFCQASVFSNRDLHPLVIDTDCALDDMRAISILLSQSEIKIKGIVVTEGTLLPAEGVRKVRALLHEFSLDTIPVACGKTFNKTAPPWREFNRSVSWGDFQPDDKPIPDAVTWLQSILVPGQEKITYVCLGPLSTLAATIGNDNILRAQLYRIIWYNESIKPAADFNYTFDEPSADSVMNMNIRTDMISRLDKEEAFFDPSIYGLSKNYSTGLATILSKTGNQPAIKENKNQHHLRIADELVSVYFTNPELFDITVMHPKVHVRCNKDYDLLSVKEVFLDMVRGTYKSSGNVVFNYFPAQREMYTYDVRKIMDSTIHRYGAEEWKACVMTDEFHGHLGVFSIVGAKMGIKARELFGVGPDKLSVKTFAGTKPPYSCLNDGIQVSTGATIGQGLIRIASDQQTRPEAIFTYNGRSIRLRLRDDYLALVDRDIAEGIVQFGLMDDGYWKLVRRSSLKYWLEWDRNVIFEIEEIKTNNP